MGIGHGGYEKINTVVIEDVRCMGVICVRRAGLPGHRLGESRPAPWAAFLGYRMLWPYHYGKGRLDAGERIAGNFHGHRRVLRLHPFLS